MRRLGCLTPFGIATGLIAVAALLLAWFIGGGAMFSPGPLNAQTSANVTLGGVASHAALGGNCAACHTSPLDTRAMADLCLDCHSDIQTQLAEPNSLHSVLPDSAACLGCHTEHGGATASLTHMDLTKFPHEKLGFALQAHQQTVDGRSFSCADCHTELTLTPRPANVYAASDRMCLDCHSMYQRDVMTTHTADFGASCMSCHDGVDRYSNFDHNALATPLEGKHAEARCITCHGQARTVADFEGLATTCVGCHQMDDIHQGAYGADCASCHSPDGWAEVTFDHNLTAFPLTGAHTNTVCTSCHVNHIYKGTPTDCVACHADPQIHLGQFGTDCNSCHSTRSWEGATFNHTFPLTHGGEGTIPCATCHTTPQQYSVYTCYNCHAHPQAATLAEHREEGMSASEIENCARCHPTGREEGD